MKAINEIKCELPGISENEGVIRGIIASFLLQTDPLISELSDIRTAVSEAVTNCIVHGYRNKSGNIKISAKLFENRVISKYKTYFTFIYTCFIAKFFYRRFSPMYG